METIPTIVQQGTAREPLALRPKEYRGVYVYVKSDEPERFLKSIRGYRCPDFGK